MRFCRACNRAMVRDTSSGAVEFRCACGEVEKGGPEDARVGGGTLGSGETTEMYHNLIRTAPYDRTNQLVRRDCPDCGLDYLTQVRVGASEVIVLRCDCGFEEIGGERAAAPQ